MQAFDAALEQGGKRFKNRNSNAYRELALYLLTQAQVKYTHACAHRHARTHARTYTRMHTCMHTCTRAHTRALVHTQHMHAHAHARTHTCTRAHLPFMNSSSQTDLLDA